MFWSFVSTEYDIQNAEVFTCLKGYPMTSYREELWLDVPSRRAFVNITPQVEAALQKSGIQEGLCLVNARGN
jgi:hypothetical protein